MSEVELTLSCGCQSESALAFDLVILNCDEKRILIPFPKVTELTFTDVASSEAEWYTDMLVSSSWAGMTLEPLERRKVSFAVRPRDVDPPNDPDDDFRWCVDITPGVYTVTYLMKVDSDYFDGDSHYRLPQIESEARRRSAHAWVGNAQSNSLKINHRTRR